MSKANRLWTAMAALLALGAALELRLHKSPASVAPTPTAKSLHVPVAVTESVPTSKGTSQVGENIGASGSAPTNANREPPTVMQIADAEQFIDRDFAAAAAKPYVEEYQRQHPMPKAWTTFSWDKARVVSVSVPEKSNASGYLCVLFPAGESPGAGFTCFKQMEDADHLWPLCAGYTDNLSSAIEKFRRGLTEDHNCLHILD